ncbi:hypothetical protein MRB53_040420 [Persea americana]|nr:hypothetical protein MRB53_040420 [Persea americana]
MITDVFGYELKNTRLLADEYAKAGFYVVMPDFFQGDSLPADLEAKMAPLPGTPKRSFFKAASDIASAVAAGAPWLYRHRDAVSRPIIDSFMTQLQAAHPNAKIGGVGFCWGGRHVILLTHPDAKVKLDAAVACHPSMLSFPTEVQKYSKPLSIQVGDQDNQMSVAQANKAREIIEQKGIAGEVTVYPETTHGFACRGDMAKAETKKSKEACTAATIAWLKKYL